jgi:sugar phosphate isomerase/epimerase
MTISKFPLGVMLREVKRPSFDESLERVRDMGFECVQLNLNMLGLPTLPASLPQGKAGEIGASFWAYGLNLAALSGTFNVAHPDDGIRKEGIAGIRTLCEAADRMGTQIITLCTGTRNTESMWQAHADNDTQEAWKDMISTIRQITKIAENHSVTLAFETEVSNIINTVEKAVRLLDEIASENLKVVMDPANLIFRDDLNRQREIFDEAFQKLGDKIVLAHAKDVGEYDESIGELKKVAAGKGLLDFEYYFRLLKSSTYQGSIIIHSLSEEEMPSSREFIANLLLRA